MAEKEKSFEQSLRDNVAQLAYDTYQSGKNFITELKESPLKTIGGLIQKGGQVRQLDKTMYDPNAFVFDPNDYTKSLYYSMNEFRDKANKGIKELKNDKKKFLGKTYGGLNNADLAFVANKVSPSINIGDYYDELYESVGGVENVYKLREKQGLNTGKLTEENLNKVLNYTAGKFNIPTEQFKDFDYEYGDDVSEAWDTARRAFMPSENLSSSGNYKKELSSSDKIKFIKKPYKPILFRSEEGSYSPAAMVGGNHGSLDAKDKSVGYISVEPNKYKDFADIFHHEMTHARQFQDKNTYDNYFNTDIYRESLKKGVVPMMEIEATIAGEMMKWQKKNGRVMITKDDLDDFIKTMDNRYGNHKIPKDIIKILAPRIVKDDKKKMFEDLT